MEDDTVLEIEINDDDIKAYKSEKIIRILTGQYVGMSALRLLFIECRNEGYIPQTVAVQTRRTEFIVHLLLALTMSNDCVNYVYDKMDSRYYFTMLDIPKFTKAMKRN